MKIDYRIDYEDGVYDIDLWIDDDWVCTVATVKSRSLARQLTKELVRAYMKGYENGLAAGTRRD